MKTIHHYETEDRDKIFRVISEIRTGFKNKHGHIVQRDGDRGDTASRDCLFFVLLTWLGIEPQSSDAAAIIELRRPQGWTRHPDTKEKVPDFVTDPTRFSRDQQTPLVVALGYNDAFRPLFFVTLGEHFYRLGKFQNKDFAAPHFWSLYFAHREDFFGYLVCYLVDVFWIVEAALACGRGVLNRFFIKKLSKKLVDQDVNLFFVLQFRRRCSPTLFTWAAWKIYLLSNPLRSIAIYFRRQTNAAPFARLYWAVMQ